MAAHRFAGLNDLVQQFDSALRSELRQCIADGQAKHRARPDQPLVFVIDELNQVVRPGQVGHGGRQAASHLAQRGQPLAATLIRQNRT